ncbi:MAG: hypothetical protein ACK418_27055, partial [Pseudomonas sp.]|uniref:hypothetical protein n=1 Tax=Pseudomonas sp. TaxID=306 RepID=UPI0039188892
MADHSIADDNVPFMPFLAKTGAQRCASWHIIVFWDSWLKGGVVMSTIDATLDACSTCGELLRLLRRRARP